MENVKNFDTFINEEWSFKNWITNISDGVKLVLSKEKMRQLRDYARNMTEEQREDFLSSINIELKRWVAIRTIIFLPTFVTLINNNLGFIEHPPLHLLILILLWFISHFMVNRNKRIKRQVIEIFATVRQHNIIPKEEIKKVYSEIDPYGEEDWEK
jgi:hypothetical protein